MGLFGFGKKKEFSSPDPLQSTTGLDSSLDLDSGLKLDGLNSSDSSSPVFDSFGNPRSQKSYESPSTFTPTQASPPAGGDISKDMELILAKLDTIKAEITSMSHRLELLENKSRQLPSTGNRRYQW